MRRFRPARASSAEVEKATMSRTEEATPETTDPAATAVAEANSDVGVGATGATGATASDRRQPDERDEGLWQRTPPSRIEDYAVVADLQTAALVSRDGSMDWLCLPRFDSSAAFAALLGGPKAGRWRIAPLSGGACTRRAYRDDTMILESTWETDEGTVTVTDFMPIRQTAAGPHPDRRGRQWTRADGGRAGHPLRLRAGRPVGAAHRRPVGRRRRPGLPVARHAGPAAGQEHAQHGGVHRRGRPTGALRADLGALPPGRAAPLRPRTGPARDRRVLDGVDRPAAPTTAATAKRCDARCWCSRR